MDAGFQRQLGVERGTENVAFLDQDRFSGELLAELARQAAEDGDSRTHSAEARRRSAICCSTPCGKRFANA